MEMERRSWILIFLIFRERNEGMKLVRFSIGSVGGEARSLINLVAVLNGRREERREARRRDREKKEEVVVEQGCAKRETRSHICFPPPPLSLMTL